MSKTYLPYEPAQQLLLPAALQEWLPDDHLAYFISDVVDQLDMLEVTARYERERRGGLRRLGPVGVVGRVEAVPFTESFKPSQQNRALKPQIPDG